MLNYAYMISSIQYKASKGISKHLLQVKDEDLRIAVTSVLDLDLLISSCSCKSAISFPKFEATVELDLCTIGGFGIVSIQLDQE